MSDNITSQPDSCWEPDIRAFEEADRKQFPARDAVLFVGSSSIALWTTLHKDFAGLPVIQRGFGGSKIADSTRYASRIVLPYRPKIIVLYAGDNDLADNRTPEQVAGDFRAFESTVHRPLPQATLIYISIKPSPSRWNLAEKMKSANSLIRACCNSLPSLAFLDVFTPMLGKDGRPRPELYAGDNLHMSRQGYELWTALLRPRVEALFHSRSESR